MKFCNPFSFVGTIVVPKLWPESALLFGLFLAGDAGCTAGEGLSASGGDEATALDTVLVVAADPVSVSVEIGEGVGEVYRLLVA